MTDSVQEIKLSRVEQLAARRAHNPEVAGSSPAPANGAEGLPVTREHRFKKREKRHAAVRVRPDGSQ